MNVPEYSGIWLLLDAEPNNRNYIKQQNTLHTENRKN